MTEEIDLEYDPASYAGEFNEEAVVDFEEWLKECQNEKFAFDPTYLQHLRKHHGGVPKKRYFTTSAGTPHVIVRFLNFLSDESEDPRSQYRVEETWSLIEDRLGKYLMPFAELFAGDMLCFDYSKGKHPSVVVWDHEKSKPRKPHVEPVATDFNTFLAGLKSK